MCLVAVQGFLGVAGSEHCGMRSRTGLVMLKGLVVN